MQEEGWLSSDSDDEESWLAMEPVHRRSSLDHQFPSNSRVGSQRQSVLSPEAEKMKRRRASRVSMRRVEDPNGNATLVDESIGQADLLEELETEGSFVLHINEWGALTPNSVAYKAKKREEVLYAEREKEREAREAREAALQKEVDALKQEVLDLIAKCREEFENEQKQKLEVERDTTGMTCFERMKQKLDEKRKLLKQRAKKLQKITGKPVVGVGDKPLRSRLTTPLL